LLSGDELAFANAIVAAADSLHDPLTTQESQLTSEPYVAGVSDFPRTQVVSAPTRPDDRADRFAHSDVTQAQPVSDGGSTVEWNDAFTLGIGVIVLALGLALAVGYVRRPRLAGL
jgi:hypothetical protein